MERVIQNTVAVRHRLVVFGKSASHVGYVVLRNQSQTCRLLKYLTEIHDSFFLTVPIAVQDKHDYVPQCISHRDQKSVGTVNSSLSQSAEFTCSDRMSPTSGSFNGAEVSVTCEAGEIMTSCSSFHAVSAPRVLFALVLL